MPGRERLRKVKSRRVVHKSTGGVLPRTPEPVDPVGNAPPPSPFNTVAHPRRRRGLSRNQAGEAGNRRRGTRRPNWGEVIHGTYPLTPFFGPARERGPDLRTGHDNG